MSIILLLVGVCLEVAAGIAIACEQAAAGNLVPGLLAGLMGCLPQVWKLSRRVAGNFDIAADA